MPVTDQRDPAVLGRPHHVEQRVPFGIREVLGVGMQLGLIGVFREGGDLAGGQVTLLISQMIWRLTLSVGVGQPSARHSRNRMRRCWSRSRPARPLFQDQRRIARLKQILIVSRRWRCQEGAQHVCPEVGKIDLVRQFFRRAGDVAVMAGQDVQRGFSASVSQPALNSNSPIRYPASLTKASMVNPSKVLVECPSRRMSEGLLQSGRSRRPCRISRNINNAFVRMQLPGSSNHGVTGISPLIWGPSTQCAGPK